MSGPQNPRNGLSTRRIALKFSYLGWDYHGLVCQKPAPPIAESDVAAVERLSIEDYLFDALERTRLIESRSTCRFERCGRTDRGVSAAGQVASLTIKSLARPDEREELGYISILNRNLPETIRILAWSPVDEEFSARFSCRWRHYKYFFTKGSMDLGLMRHAADKLVGEHDFRNFCKIDPSKQLEHFQRRIISASIEPFHTPERAGEALDQSRESFWVFNLRGSAFLYHQVRHIMALLFLIGSRLERPELIDELLDIDKTPGKPSYEMASEIPLALWECGYDPGALDWRTSDGPSDWEGRLLSRSLERNKSHMESLWYRHQTKANMIQAMMLNLEPNSSQGAETDDETLARDPLGAFVSDRLRSRSGKLLPALRVSSTQGAGQQRMTASYLPLSDRQKGPPPALVNERYRHRKARLSDGLENADREDS